MTIVGFFDRHMGKILLALIVVSAAAAVVFTLDLRRTLGTDVSPPPPLPSAEAKGKAVDLPALQPKTHYALIARRNLFAFQEPPEGSRPVVEQKKPETPLNARLKGTIISPQGLSLAMIEDATQRKEDLYLVGDSIQDAKILRILPNQVVLQRGNREETLTLFTEGGAKGTAKPGASPVPTAQPQSSPAVAARAPAPGSPPVQQKGATQQIQTLMAQLRLRPHFQDGKPAGFVVGQVQKGGVFEASGLKEGDIITAVNDQEVKTPNQLLKAYRDVSEEKELWLDVLRGAAEETIEVNLEGVVSKD